MITCISYVIIPYAAVNMIRFSGMHARNHTQLFPSSSVILYLGYSSGTPEGTAKEPTYVLYSKNPAILIILLTLPLRNKI